MVRGVVNRWKRSCSPTEILIGPGVALLAIALVVVALAGCSDDADEPRQAVYKPHPTAAVRPARPGYGQQVEQPRGRVYQQQVPQQNLPGPRFEVVDPGNPWAYRPIPQYTPEPQTTPGQPWADSRGYRSVQRPDQGTRYGFGGYRPLDKDKPSQRETDTPGAAPPGGGMPAYPYYPAPYPYGTVAPFGYQNPMGWPGAGWPPVW